MSRATIILIVVLCAALAALLVLPSLKKPKQAPVPIASTSPAPATPDSNRAVAPPRPAVSPVPAAPTVSSGPNIVTSGSNPTRPIPGGSIIRTDDETLTNLVSNPDLKPLPVLEKNYLSTTNREDRLDIIMDISETANADAIKTLGRLFGAETDPDLKVDVIDSLLTIDGFKDEKLELLKLGVQPGLPNEVRQSAIDGLIDLEDMRVMSLLNGLLNDPNPEIREAAQDAIDLVQTPIEQTPKLK